MRIRTAEDLGRMLREERKRQGYTRAELAEAAGVGVTYVINIEHGKQTAEIGKALHLVELLSIDLVAERRGACGGKPSNVDLSDNKFVGTWKASAITLGEASENVEDDWILTVNGDDTGTLDDGKEVSNFTWSPTDNGFKTTGDLRVTFTEEGDTIKTTIIGADLVFERQ